MKAHCHIRLITVLSMIHYGGGCCCCGGGGGRGTMNGWQMSTLLGMAQLHKDSALRVSPFCHETADRRREMRGWVLDTPGDADASALPVPYNLFHGVSVTMCETTEAEVLALMQHPTETRQRLGAAIDAIMARTHWVQRCQSNDDGAEGAAVKEGRRATWARCRPALDGVPSSLHGAVRVCCFLCRMIWFMLGLSERQCRVCVCRSRTRRGALCLCPRQARSSIARRGCLS